MKTFLSFILTLLGDLFNAVLDAFEKKKGFNADFGSEANIASRFNKGFSISKHRRLTRRKSFENILLSGPTGSGKSVKFIIKNLYLLNNCSIVVNDPSGELRPLTSGYRSRCSVIKTLAFSDSTVSCGFNILSRIKKPQDVNKLAHLLVAGSLDSKGNSDPFWSIQAANILQIFIRLVLHQPKEYQCIVNVLNALKNFASQPQKTVDVWIAKTNDAKLILDYKSLISMPQKTLMSCIATAKAALEIFEDPEVAKITSYDSIDFEELRKTPTTLYLQNSVADLRYLRVLSGIFFEQLYGHILRRLPEKQELDLFIILEEASSLYVPLLPLALANCRKHRVGNLVCVQSAGQLKTMYKDEADNIAANCVTKIYLPGQTSMETLRDLEALSGKCIYIDDKKQERVKQLLTVDEIRLLPENRTLILSGNQPFIKGRTSPYYKSFIYKGYAKIPPVPLQGDIPDEPIALLQ